MRFSGKKGRSVLSLGVLCALVMPMTNIFGEASAVAQVCGDGICDEVEDCESCPADCGPCQIPTVSEWGLIIMTLLALTAGTIVFARRRRATLA